jgi:DNA invertase Pin-like site-specific DNA recombinase
MGKDASRVAIYARVSTMNGQNPEVQLRELREYCQHRGWKIVREYVERESPDRRKSGRSWIG